MVCYHQSEWGVDYASLKSEIETLLDEGIKKEKNAEKKQILEDKKQLTLHLIEEKITAFDFWSKVKVPVPNKLPGMPADMIYDPIRDQCRKRNPWEIGFEYEQKDENEEEYTPFPTSTKVYHFHPIAFVEQMKRMGEYICCIDREYFYEHYLVEFGEVSNELKVNLEVIFEGIEKYETKNKGAFTKSQVAYILATIKHETGYYKPIIESNWCSESVRKKYYEEMYDPILGKNEKRRSMALNNENTEQGDGVKYAGKGFVQITWKKNYRKAKEKFGIDFVANPNLALVPKYSIDIALYGFDSGMFTNNTIHDFINNDKCDYYNARRVINGTDAADIIERYAEKFEKCLKLK